jgi:hypothetical protein
MCCGAARNPELPGCPVQLRVIERGRAQPARSRFLGLAYPELGGDWLKWVAAPQQAWFRAGSSTEPQRRHR